MRPSGSTASKMFDGLTSRWTMPCSWPCWSADRTPLITAIASRTGKAPRRSIHCSIVSPRSSSMTRTSVPSGSSRKSKIRTMLRCPRSPPSRASRRKRSSAWGVRRASDGAPSAPRTLRSPRSREPDVSHAPRCQTAYENVFPPDARVRRQEARRDRSRHQLSQLSHARCPGAASRARESLEFRGVRVRAEHVAQHVADLLLVQ